MAQKGQLRPIIKKSVKKQVGIRPPGGSEFFDKNVEKTLFFSAELGNALGASGGHFRTVLVRFSQTFEKMRNRKVKSSQFR